MQKIFQKKKKKKCFKRIGYKNQNLKMKKIFQKKKKKKKCFKRLGDKLHKSTTSLNLFVNN